ncbi:MAG TPA: NADH-quinone oxidoreductase subunit J [Candidatus Binatia bacterium]|nr:NADH-quinone oxidoreductase subunit J [Candidatus Binatia bacterium]
MIVFWLLALALVASAVFVITAKKPVYSVVGLLANFTALAIMYLTLSAEFLAVIQIVVYSGAILVLFVFVIALLSSGVAPFLVGPDRLPAAAGGGTIAALIGLALVVFGITQHPATIGPAGGAAPVGPVGTAGAFGSVADFGNALFTVYLLPFEITALILMVAVVAVILLAGDTGPSIQQRLRRKREPIVRDPAFDAAMHRGEPSSERAS